MIMMTQGERPVNSRDPVTWLSNELLMQILDLLSQTDLLQALQVSHSWYNAITWLSRILENPVFRDNVTTSQFCGFLQFASRRDYRIRTLDLTCRPRETNKILRKLLESGIQPESLTVPAVSDDEFLTRIKDDSKLAQLLAQLSELKLHLRRIEGSASMNSLLAHLTGLKSLSLVSLVVPEDSYADVFYDVNVFKGLESLELTMDPFAVSPTYQENLICSVLDHNRFPSLQKLVLNSCPISTDDFVRLLPKSLRWLVVSDLLNVSSHNLIQLLREIGTNALERLEICNEQGKPEDLSHVSAEDLSVLSNLKVFRAHRTRLSYDGILKVLQASNENLEEVTISCMGKIDFGDYSALHTLMRKCPNLKSLTLFRCWSFNDLSCAYLSQALASSGIAARLRELDISRNNITRGGVGSLLNRESPLRLSKLRVKGCKKLDEEFIQHLTMNRYCSQVEWDGS